MKNLTNEQGAEMMNGLVDYATKALQSGVLLKNVKATFTNKGVSSDLADSILEKAEINFKDLSHYKAK